MQVTPEAGRDTASRFGLPYDWTRLICDPVYNTQMGAAELAGLTRDYRGSLVLIFAGYNAGRGRVEKWIAQYGDPRDPTLIRSTGSNASRSRKRAIMLSG
jgi:soluble lytic murein transglycosylase